MQQKKSSQKKMAIFFFFVLMGAFVFFNYQDENKDFKEPKFTKPKKPNRIRTFTKPEPSQLSGPNEKDKNDSTSQTLEETTQKKPEIVVKSSETIVSDFKNLVELDFALPSELKFYNLGFEQIEGIGTHDGDEGLAIVAAPFKANLDQALQYIKQDRADYIFLREKDFSQIGKTQEINISSQSGISKITLVSGGTVDGKTSYAALAERKDGRGTYLFIFKTADEYEKIKPLINEVLSSLKTKK